MNEIRLNDNFTIMEKSDSLDGYITKISDSTSCMYVIGDKHRCYAFFHGSSFTPCRIPINKIENLLIDNICFIRINMYVIVNTKFYLRLHKKREIIMKNGMVFKVSRSKINLFDHLE